MYNQFTAKVRFDNRRFDLQIDASLEARVLSTLEEIQAAMLAKARAERDAHVVPVTECVVCVQLPALLL